MRSSKILTTWLINILWYDTGSCYRKASIIYMVIGCLHKLKTEMGWDGMTTDSITMQQMDEERVQQRNEESSPQTHLPSLRLLLCRAAILRRPGSVDVCSGRILPPLTLRPRILSTFLRTWRTWLVRFLLRSVYSTTSIVRVLDAYSNHSFADKLAGDEAASSSTSKSKGKRRASWHT